MLDRRIKIFQISRRLNMKVKKKRRLDPYLKCLLQRRVHCKNPSQRKRVMSDIISTRRTHTKPRTEDSES